MLQAGLPESHPIDTRFQEPKLSTDLVMDQYLSSEMRQMLIMEEVQRKTSSAEWNWHQASPKIQ